MRVKRLWFSIAAILAASIISMAAYPYLPDQVPTHWNAMGEPDDYSSKLFGATFIPAMMTGLLILLQLLPKIDPKKQNYQKFKGSYTLFIQLFMAFFLLLHAATIGYSLGFPIDISMIVPIAVGLLFVIIGNYMPRFKHNYFTGIKTPWTLASEAVWNKTHRLGGKVFVLMGLAGIASAFIPGPWNFILFLGFVIGGTAFLMIASYVFYQKEKGSAT